MTNHTHFVDEATSTQMTSDTKYTMIKQVSSTAI